jgi:hypothetical protein
VVFIVRALIVPTTGRERCTHTGANLFTQPIINPRPAAITVPRANVMIDGLPMGQIICPQASGSAAAPHIPYAFDDVAQGIVAGTPCGLGLEEWGL